VTVCAEFAEFAVFGRDFPVDGLEFVIAFLLKTVHVDESGV
jgi:hypothetical protein